MQQQTLDKTMRGVDMTGAARTKQGWVLVTTFILATYAITSGLLAQSSPNAEPMELQHGVPFVKVVINGKGPFRFSIDTGTGGEALVCPALAEKLGLPTSGEAEVGDPSAHQSHKEPVYLISSLKVAGIEFKDIKAVRHEPFPGEGDCDGTLGFLMFRNYLFSLDYRRQLLLLSVGSLTADNGKNVIPFTIRNDIPLITVKVENGQVDAHIDSGSMHGLSLTEDFAKSLEFTSKPVVVGRGMTMSGDFEIKGARLAGDIQIAGYTFSQPFVEINPVFPVANFGSIPLQHFAVAFDQKNKLVRFVCDERSLTINPPRMPAMAPVLSTGTEVMTQQTAGEQKASIPSTPAGKLLREWLEAFNSGDRERMKKFQTEHNKSMTSADMERQVEMDMGLRQQTGGFDFVRLERASDTEISAVVKEKASGRRARLTLAVSKENAELLAGFNLQLVHVEESELPAPQRKPLDQFLPELDAQLAEETAHDKFSGAVLIAKDGNVLWQKAYGYANRELKVLNTLRTRFRLGSMNKMFTSVAIAQLVQQGKLKYSQKLNEVLPDYLNHEAAAKITIEQLLTHTSGLGDFFGEQFLQKKDQLRDLKDYLPLLAGKPLLFEPGQGWSYSNAGFLVLGLIVEKLSAQSYYDYVKQNIYDVAGMKDSGSSPTTQPVPNLAIGYTRGEHGELVPNTPTLPWRGGPAGGGDSTVGDLLRFDQALRNHKLLNRELTETITTGKVHPPQAPPEVRYAYGFNEDKRDGGRVVGHGGGAPGMNAELDMDIARGYTVVVLSNLAPPAAESVVRQITRTLP